MHIKNYFRQSSFAISWTDYWPFAATHSTSQVSNGSTAPKQGNMFICFKKKHGKMGLYCTLSQWNPLPSASQKKGELKRKAKSNGQMRSLINSRQVCRHSSEGYCARCWTGKTGTKAEATCTQTPVQVFCPEVEVVSLALWSCRKGNARQSIT